MLDDSYTSLTIEQAMERLTFPSFFSHRDRKDAYELVMRIGTAEQKLRAYHSDLVEPIHDKQSELFSLRTEISVAIDDQRIRIGE